MACFKDEMMELITAIDDTKMQDLLTKIVNELDEKDRIIKNQAEEITKLKNDVTDIEQRITEQERYSSKDCLILENLPINFQNNLFEELCVFFKTFLNYDCKPYDFKAAHPINKGKAPYPPTVIVKFIYFDMKNELYSRRSWLAGRLNPKNSKPVFIKERLPKKDMEILIQAKEKGYITTTSNCQVKVFCKTSDGQKQSVPVNSIRALTDIKSRAIIRSKDQKNANGQKQSTPFDVQSTSSDTILKEHHEKFLKRIRETESDVDKLALLNEELMNKKTNLNRTPPALN